MKTIFNLVLIVVILETAPISYAKRQVPKPVEPVIYNGVEFQAPLGVNKMGYIQAWKDNVMIWEKKLYNVWRKPWIEGDVQDVYITSLLVQDDVLIVQNEKHKTFRVNLKSIPELADEKKDDTDQLIVKGNTEFAFDLYAQLKDQKGNLFFSPYSISTALAMTYAGAARETAGQIYQTLCIPERYRMNIRPDLEHAAFGRLLRQINDPNRSNAYQLSVANALWAQTNFPFSERFKFVNQRYYKAGLENVDFIKETEKTRQKINKWVENKTNEKIKDLIPEGALNTMTRLVLTNAIYFKGDWASQFDKDRTEDADFCVSPDKTVKAPLMFQKEKLKYGQAENLQLLELPYKGDDLSMLVLLAKEKDGLADLEKELNAENLAEWQKHIHQKEVLVYLPKFKMTSKFSLEKTLTAMGMPNAFSQAADFSHMVDSGIDMVGAGGARPINTTTPKLSISDVIHKAFVEVNEEGTEAAAATGVNMRVTSMPAPPPVFRADHPFIFIIKDNNTGSILFIGRVMDPTKESEE